MFSGLTKNGESIEMFKKEVLFIMKNDPDFMYLSTDDKDKLMGKSVITGLSGAPKSTVDPYKARDIQMVLKSIYCFKNTKTKMKIWKCLKIFFN